MDTGGGTSGRDLTQPSRRALRWMWLPGVFVVLALGLWWAGHPAELPTSDQAVSATTKVGAPVYVGVLPRAGEERRTLEVDTVEITVTSPEDATGVSVEALICKGGAIGQTSAPERFCREVVPAEGHTLHLDGGDQLMVSVTADDPGTVEVARLELAFREGLQRGSRSVGAPYSVSVVG